MLNRIPVNKVVNQIKRYIVNQIKRYILFPNSAILVMLNAIEHLHRLKTKIVSNNTNIQHYIVTQAFIHTSDFLQNLHQRCASQFCHISGYIPKLLNSFCGNEQKKTVVKVMLRITKLR